MSKEKELKLLGKIKNEISSTIERKLGHFEIRLEESNWMLIHFVKAVKSLLQEIKNNFTLFLDCLSKRKWLL